MTTVYVLYGEIGSGKTHVGRHIANQTGLPFIDGDSWLPEHLSRKVEYGLPLTKKDVMSFVEGRLIPCALEEYRCRGGFILAQALYSAQLRDLLQRTLCRELDASVIYVRIKPASWWQNLRGLLSRKFGLVWVASWILSKPFFEAGSALDLEITNDRTTPIEGNVRSLIALIGNRHW
jgi:gluconate kinase